MSYLFIYLFVLLLLIAFSLPSIPFILEEIFGGYWLLLEYICIPGTVVLIYFIIEFAKGL